MFPSDFAFYLNENPASVQSGTDTFGYQTLSSSVIEHSLAISP
jgi:hypothetical protein